MRARRVGAFASGATRSIPARVSSSSLLVSACAAAARRRQLSLPADTDVLRLVDDEADGCAGLVVDRYGPVLRLELRGRSWPSDAEPLARALLEEAGAAHAVGLLRVAGGRTQMRILGGDPPQAHVVHEAGMRLWVRTVEAEAVGTGVFVDQREGRARVRRRAAGAVVLNLFAHAGAFGAAAAVGGAARVDHVDAARKCAPWAALNLALNGEDPRRHRFLVDDALAVLARAARRAEREGAPYDVIICDPPTTAVRPDGSRFHVEQHLAQLAADCLRSLRPAGALLLSTNDRALQVDDVAAAVRAAAAQTGRSITSLEEVKLPRDLPSASDPALRPMRGIWVAVA